VQEKFDGRRMLVRKRDDRIDGINRNGLIVALPTPLATAVANRPGNFIMDGESIGETLIAFDLLELNGVDYRPRSYEMRLARLVRLIAGSPSNLILAQTALDSAAKTELFAQLRSGGKEGAVFKALRAPYQPGRPASGGDALKLKFCETASFIVAKLNGNRSVSLILFDKKKNVPVGSVTIPPNKKIPRFGQVVEVRYLYAFRGGSIFQPVYLGVRSDIDPAECVLGQLKFKAEKEETA